MDAKCSNDTDHHTNETKEVNAAAVTLPAIAMDHCEIRSIQWAAIICNNYSIQTL